MSFLNQITHIFNVNLNIMFLSCNHSVTLLYIKICEPFILTFEDGVVPQICKPIFSQMLQYFHKHTGYVSS